MSLTDLFPHSKHDPKLVKQVMREMAQKKLQQKVTLYKETLTQYRTLLGMAVALEARGGTVDEHTSTVSAARFELQRIQDELIAAALTVGEVES